ncbi:hypothetical protein S245_047504, partial [Arachis hypogaea]
MHLFPYYYTFFKLNILQLDAYLDCCLMLAVLDMEIERSGENKILRLRFTSSHKRSK